MLDVICYTCYMLYIEPTGTHGTKYKKLNAMQEDHFVLETPHRETTVFGSHDLKYYTTSDWLGQGGALKQHIKTCGDHCDVEMSYR